MTLSEPIQKGAAAPGFSLQNHRGEAFTLSGCKGRRVLLSFHPLAWTSVCTGQMKSLESNFERFRDRHTLAVGISVDSVPCKRAWADHLKIQNTPLLSDFWPHGEVAREYGVFNPDRGTALRSNVLVDEEGAVIFCRVYPGGEVPDIGEILTVLEQID